MWTASIKFYVDVDISCEICSDKQSIVKTKVLIYITNCVLESVIVINVSPQYLVIDNLINQGTMSCQFLTKKRRIILIHNTCIILLPWTQMHFCATQILNSSMKSRGEKRPSTKKLKKIEFLEVCWCLMIQRDIITCGNIQCSLVYPLLKVKKNMVPGKMQGLRIRWKQRKKRKTINTNKKLQPHTLHCYFLSKIIHSLI